MFEEKLSKKDQVYFLLSSVSGREIWLDGLLDLQVRLLGCRGALGLIQSKTKLNVVKWQIAGHISNRNQIQIKNRLTIYFLQTDSIHASLSTLRG